MDHEIVKAEPQARLLLTKQEVVALIWQITPENTFIGQRALELLWDAFPGGVEDAREVLADIGGKLTRIHDREL